MHIMLFKAPIMYALIQKNKPIMLIICTYYALKFMVFSGLIREETDSL